MTRRVVSVVAALGVLAPALGWAQGVLSVEIVNGYNLVVDSNVTAPSTYAPRSAYIGATVCNTGDAAARQRHRLRRRLQRRRGGHAGRLPHVELRRRPAAVHRRTPADYSLTIEADDTGTADGTRYIGTLAPGRVPDPVLALLLPAVRQRRRASRSRRPATSSITGGIKPDDDVVARLRRLGHDHAPAGSRPPPRPATSPCATRSRPRPTRSGPTPPPRCPTSTSTAIQSVIGWGTLGPDGQPLTAGEPRLPGPAA